MKKFVSTLSMLSLALVCGIQTSAFAQNSTNYKIRTPSQEITYFLLLDRFENGDKSNDNGGYLGDKYQSGFDPSHKGFYHGGDLRGLINRLDYIKSLGATAIWLGPIFKNKAVQGAKGQESAGYHGYWVNDFTTIDPHFGTEAEFKEFITKAHKMGFKVYMDIITNHTSDVIYFEECVGKNDCEYRDTNDYPEIAYNPIIPKGEEAAKKPNWLNDVKNYNNRGNSKWWGESALYGDFAGLDDINTDNENVINGFIEIYGAWIDKYKIDGYRIDTVKHVSTKFWQKFIPAIKSRAKLAGIDNFHIFGEVYIDGVNPGALAIYTKRDKMPSVLDFSFQSAVYYALAKNSPTEIFENLFTGDMLYEGGEKNALNLQTFVSNHDMGRISTMLKRENIPENEILPRVKLANAMLMLLRGAPTIYSGDEQGFLSDGHDQDAREDMFASSVASYNDNDLLGTEKTNATPSFDLNHPLFLQIKNLADIRNNHIAFANSKQILRKIARKTGILAVSRFSTNGKEYIIAFNTANEKIEENIKTSSKNKNWQSLYGNCAQHSNKDGVIKLNLEPLSYSVCMVK